MQTTKFLLVIGLAAVLATPSGAIAGPDTEAQARMREALRQKMAELDAQAAPALAPAPTPAPIAPTPAPPVAPAQTVVVPVPVEPAPMRIVPAPMAAPTPAPAPASSGTFFPAEPTAQELANDAKLREALRQRMAAEKATAPAPVVAAQPAPPKATPAVISAVPPAATPAPAAVAATPATVQAVPSPFSSSQQARLADLLRRYKADAITPMEYHKQRAAIIAEP